MKTVIECPAALRADALRALGRRMRTVDTEMNACRSAALELGLHDAAQRIDAARAPWVLAERGLPEVPR